MRRIPTRFQRVRFSDVNYKPILEVMETPEKLSSKLPQLY
jgi:hypothetical protein